MPDCGVNIGTEPTSGAAPFDVWPIASAESVRQLIQVARAVNDIEIMFENGSVKETFASSAVYCAGEHLKV